MPADHRGNEKHQCSADHGPDNGGGGNRLHQGSDDGRQYSLYEQQCDDEGGGGEGQVQQPVPMKSQLVYPERDGRAGVRLRLGKAWLHRGPQSLHPAGGR